MPGGPLRLDVCVNVCVCVCVRACSLLAAFLLVPSRSDLGVLSHRMRTRPQSLQVCVCVCVMAP